MCKYCPHLCNLLRLNCPIFAPMKAQVLILLLLLFLLSITDGQLATVVPLGVWSYVILPVVVSILTILTLTKLSIARATQGIRYDRACSTHKMYPKSAFIFVTHRLLPSFVPIAYRGVQISDYTFPCYRPSLFSPNVFPETRKEN